MRQPASSVRGLRGGPRKDAARLNDGKNQRRGRRPPTNMFSKGKIYVGIDIHKDSIEIAIRLPS